MAIHPQPLAFPLPLWRVHEQPSAIWPSQPHPANWNLELGYSLVLGAWTLGASQTARSFSPNLAKSRSRALHLGWPLTILLSFFTLCPALSASAQSRARILKVENEGLLFTDNKAGVTGVDGYFSLPMGKQTAWFFGDVFLLDPNAPVKHWLGDVSNCALLTPSGKGRRGLATYHFLTNPQTAIARPVITNRPDEGHDTRFWPLAGYYDESQRVAYLYYNLVEFTKEGGPFGFRVIGYGLAKSDARDPEKLQFERVKSSAGNDLWGRIETSPSFGLAMVSGMPGPQLYLFSDQDHKRKGVATLARVSRQHIAEQQAYEYFSGTVAAPAWSTNVNDATNLAGLADISGSLSVAYNKYLGGYLAVHHVGIGEKMRLSIAKEPWGPYEKIGEITAPHRAFAKAFCYDSAEHPELQEENGRIIYITYVDSDRYWQQLYKVTLQTGKPGASGANPPTK